MVLRYGWSEVIVGAISRGTSPGRLQGMTGKQPFEEVVARHGATVLRVCRAVLGPVDADDAWSETFLSAMKAYPDLPNGANVEAWLVTIAHRKAIDVTRSAARRPIPVAQTPEDVAALDADTPGRVLEGALASDLAETVARLPARQRQAVAYHYLAGLPYGEVAAITGGSVEAARRAAADGIAAIRRTYPGAGRHTHAKGEACEQR